MSAIIYCLIMIKILEQPAIYFNELVLEVGEYSGTTKKSNPELYCAYKSARRELCLLEQVDNMVQSPVSQ